MSFICWQRVPATCPSHHCQILKSPDPIPDAMGLPQSTAAGWDGLGHPTGCSPRAPSCSRPARGALEAHARSIFLPHMGDSARFPLQTVGGPRLDFRERRRADSQPGDLQPCTSQHLHDAVPAPLHDADRGTEGDEPPASPDSGGRVWV